MADKLPVDPEMLIGLVEKRPCLWDKSSEYYRDYVTRAAAWTDICAILKPEYECWDRKARNTYAKVIMRKWTNLRDAWKKSVMEERIKPYAYHEQLKFLMKNPDFKMNRHFKKYDDDTDDTSDSGPSTSKKKKTKDNEAQSTDVQEIENPHISFIKGLVPALKKLDEEETLEFQMGVIKLLKVIREKQIAESESSAQMSVPSSSLETVDIKEENIE